MVVTFIVGNLNFLVAAIAYAIISYITAVIVCLIDRCRRKNRDRDDGCFCFENCNQNRDRECGRNCERRDDLLTISSCCQSDNSGNLLRISSNGCNGVTNDLLTINSDCNGEHSDVSCCNSNRINARVNVIPNSNTNGRTGCFCGNYRRR